MTVIKPMPLKFGVGYTISDRDMGLLTDEEKSNLSRLFPLICCSHTPNFFCGILLLIIAFSSPELGGMGEALKY